MYNIITPENSFIRFDGEAIQHCIFGTFSSCLPVYTESDIAFQFVVQADTEGEASALCSPYGSGITIGIVRDCEQVGYDVEFLDVPERFRISDRQVLYNWPHGLPGMIGEINTEECFQLRITVGEQNFCTNCFQRIPDDCFTSVVEYGNDDNFAGFNYCNSEAVDEEAQTCEPEVITFNNKETLSVPYTTSLKDKFGDVPTLQVWVYVDGVLTNVGITATFDAMPPSMITFDFGGTSSGIIVIR